MVQDWPYWIRDGNGNIIPEGTEGAGLMDFTHSFVQDMIVEQAIAVSKCGLFDGIVFDWWHETGAILADQNSGSEGYRGIDAEQRARDVILQRIRAESRPNFLIQVNSNRGKIPRTAPYINGLTMETGIPNWFTTDDALNNALLETESALLWAEDNLREPRINGVAGEALYGQAEDSPNNRRWARVLLTLSLTHANGYAVYQTHAGFGASAWIDLFDADLGRPVGPKATLYDEHIPGPLHPRVHERLGSVQSQRGGTGDTAAGGGAGRRQRAGKRRACASELGRRDVFAGEAEESGGCERGRGGEYIGFDVGGAGVRDG